MAKEKLGRYGENPHQEAWKDVDEAYEGPTVLAEPLHGKPIGYNNILDAEGALSCALDLYPTPAVAVIKHTNPCGFATGDDLVEAFINAWYGDEISAYGSIVSATGTITEDFVKLLKGKFVEILVAPEFDEGALAWVKKQTANKYKGLRMIQTGSLEDAPEFVEERKVRGGTVSQTADNRLYLCETVGNLLGGPIEMTEPNSGIEYNVGAVTEKKFDSSMKGLVEFAVIAGKNTKSNAIILAYEYGKGKYRVLGMGAGQPNRKDSGEKLALTKAQENLMRQHLRENELDYAMTMDKMIKDPEYNKRMVSEIREYARDILSSEKVVLFSDAFFPKRDGLVAAAELGVKYIVQPGGSKGDESVTQAANEMGVAMCFTGIRHFRH